MNEELEKKIEEFCDLDVSRFSSFKDSNKSQNRVKTFLNSYLNSLSSLNETTIDGLSPELNSLDFSVLHQIYSDGIERKNAYTEYQKLVGPQNKITESSMFTFLYGQILSYENSQLAAVSDTPANSYMLQESKLRENSS